MTARTYAALSMILMILGRVADTLVTYRFSPTLDLEANPLVSVMGGGWSLLLSVNLLVVVAVGYCTLSWCKNPSRYQHSGEVHDLWTFASHACYGRVHAPLTFLGRRLLVPPTKRTHTLHLIGAVMPITVAVVSAAAVLSWQAVHGPQPWESYSLLYQRLWPFFPYVIVVPTIWVAALAFYRYEYRRYQQDCAMKTSPDEAPGSAEAMSIGAHFQPPDISLVQL